MKTRSGLWTCRGVIALLTIASCQVNSWAQEPPEIEAFIAGIDGYEEAVVSTPVVGDGSNDVPPNMLPGGNETDFVVPQRPPKPQTRFQPVQSQNAPVAEQTTIVSCEPVSDYFASEYAPVEQSVRSTWVVGVNALIFDRELDGNRLFSTNATDTLNSDQADPDNFGGIDITLGRRTSRGRGFEARYLGLYPGSATEILGATPTTAINGLSQINDLGTALSDTFNAADFHSLTRDFSVNNAEFNLLRNGRTRAPLGRGMTVEWLGGFRYLQFDESLEYAGVSAANPIIRSALNSSVENSLFGAQGGCRAEWHVFNRMSFLFGGKLGLFNNRARTNIVATNQLGSDLSFRRPVITNGPNPNTEFEFGDTKDDLSLLGEFDLGLVYQMTLRSRLRFGYRGIGVSNIANAERNIPTDFTDTTVLGSADTDGDLILRGAYIGAELAF